MTRWHLPPGDTYFGPILAQTPEGFELHHLEYALKFASEFRVAVDVGAHIGTWSVALAKRFSRVYAFEPAKDTYECLVKNTVSIPHIVPIFSALGAHQGGCMSKDDPSRPGNTGARIIVEGVETPLTTIDHYHFKYVDFLKIDVEGFEIEVLKGAVWTLELCKPIVVLECKNFTPPRFGGPEIAKAFMLKLGYKEVGGVRNDRVFVHAT